MINAKTLQYINGLNAIAEEHNTESQEQEDMPAKRAKLDVRYNIILREMNYFGTYCMLLRA